MQASSFECILIAMCDLYYKETINTPTAQSKKLDKKSILKWYSAELLAIAREAKWTPAALPPNVTYNEQKRYRKKAKIGDYLKRVHELRNLVHPARYLLKHHGKRITKAYYDDAEEVGEIGRKWIAYQDSVRETAKLSKKKRQPKKTR
jgi:hypothetical protein